MPQRSHGFAVGRIAVLAQNLMNRQALERLTSAPSADAVARILVELGWGEAKDQADIARLADRRVAEACELLKDITPEPDATDCFLLKYDALNLKLLLKSRVLGIADAELSPCGTLDPERLRRAVLENNYSDLPDALKLAMQEIERRIAVQMDPLFVDVRLDKAMYEMILDRLARVKSEPLHSYFQQKLELTNLMIALRCAKMGRSAAFARELLIEGGALDPDAVAHLAEDPEQAARLTGRRPYAGVVAESMAAPDLTQALTQLERRADDQLMGLIRPHKNEIGGVLPLVGYLLATERESSVVRLIATAKNARVPQDVLNARLRELYV